MYRSEDLPTQELSYHRPGSQNRWLIVGMAAAVALVLVLGVVIVSRGSGGGPLPASAAGTPTGTASAGPAEPSADATADAQSGDTGGDNDGGASGGGNGGAEPPGGEEPPAPPQPLELAASIEVPQEGHKVGCTARGWIQAHGGEYPLEVSYLWLRVTKIGNLKGVPLPMSGEQTVVFNEPGQQSVDSPPFPPQAAENQLQLQVLHPQEIKTGLVSYPQCTD